jgi:hypothetical protein
MVTRRRGIQYKHRRAKTNRRKQTYRNNSITKSRVTRFTRKIKSSSQYGGGKSVRQFPSNPSGKKAKSRWGVRYQNLVAQKEVHPDVLDEVLRLPPTEQHDIPANFARRNQPPGAINPNISIKIKKVKKSDYKGKPFHKTGSRSIETGDAFRFVSAVLDDPDPYEMILIDYKVINSHVTPYRQLRLNLKSLSSYIFGKLTDQERQQFLQDIRIASDYIKQGQIKRGKAIVDQKNKLLERKGSTFRLAPKVSSEIDESAGQLKGQKRLQGVWKAKLSDPSLLKYVQEESPPSSGESVLGVEPNAWQIGRPKSKKEVSKGQAGEAKAGPVPSLRKPSLMKKTKLTEVPEEEDTILHTAIGKPSLGAVASSKKIKKLSVVPEEEDTILHTAIRKPSFSIFERPKDKKPSLGVFEDSIVIKPSLGAVALSKKTPSVKLGTTPTPTPTFFQTADDFFRSMYPSPGNSPSDIDD